MKHPVRNLVVNLVLAVILIGVLIGATLIHGLNDISLEIGGITLGFNDNGSFLTNSDAYERGSEGSVSAAEVKSLDIAWIAGKVNIEVVEGDTISFSEESNASLKESQIMRWNIENGVLSIRFGTNKGFGHNSPEKTLTVKIPAETWQAKKVEISTVSASTDVGSLCADTFRFDSVSGELEIGSLEADQVELSSVSGAFKLSLMSVGYLSADTVSGDFKFEGTADSMEWDSTSGDAELVITSHVNRIELDTTSGDVTLKLPDGVSGFTAELDSVSGEISCAYDTRQSGDRLSYGDGSIEIKMDSTSGDLKIK